jgi:hypothetical protein
MAKIEIPKELPECDLFSILAEKVEQRKNIDFNFFGRLDEFRQRVSGEVRQINVLFPEYTPHDEQYHLKRLFHVADAVLSRNLLEAMNSAELFVLAVALYGHDWGMAVSESEKEYIITGKPAEGVRAEDLWILSDEQQRFAKFIREQRLSTDVSGHVKEIPIEMWREYVRQTHAFRSGERVRRFFEPIDQGIADASSRICIGHWLNFEDLEDYRLYPPDFSVLGETVNLRALTVYLRLIDLLDLADDRTPYVIWKFVAPRDPHSRMEWARHRALRPVTCPPYQAGRIIRVDGSTDDHEVYAALEDLRIWCGEQLRGCNDVLARMNDPRHKLDLYHIDWCIAARGFSPVSIQFEFDRERMFEILSDEIYQGDPYVFLRELLQNSIDAIRMRREVLQRKGIDPGSLGVIRVTVEHRTGGDAIVTWQDDGIGMDEYVVRNYLAVAGKSYYTSSDFEREGLKMDPISRFGVGILSCFMAADRIQIETFKDPYLPTRGDAIRITVPAMRRQFRIETLPQEGAQVGTTLRVFVEGKKFPADKEGNLAKPLDVTGYLSIVAGFVEFPVIIKEGIRKTVVLHPKQDANAARQRFGGDFNVHQIDLSYPWSEVFFPQDLLAAREVLGEEYYDIASDLGLKGYEGSLTYPIPTDDKVDMEAHGHGLDATAIIRGRPEYITKPTRFLDKWEDYFSGESVGMSRSSKHSQTYAVYRDGILISQTSAPGLRQYEEKGPLPVPRLLVNIPKSQTLMVDLSRTHLLEQSKRWDAPILEAHRRLLIEKSFKHLLSLEPIERWYQLGRLIAFHNIEADELWEIFPHDSWPVLILEPECWLNALEWKDIASDELYLFPQDFSDELGTVAHYQLITQEEYKGILRKWNGERCHVSDLGVRHVSTSSISKASDLWSTAISKSHCLVSIRFLKPPWKSSPPLLQKIFVPMEIPESPLDIELLLEKAINDPTQLNALEKRQLGGRFFGSFRIPPIVEFSKPFEEAFAYGYQILNTEHPVTQVLLRVLSKFALSKIRRTLPPGRVGYLDDALNFLINDRLGWEQWVGDLRRFWLKAREVGLFHEDKLEDLVPSKEEFVPGSIESEKPPEYYKWFITKRMQTTRFFGQPLK